MIDWAKIARYLSRRKEHYRRMYENAAEQRRTAREERERLKAALRTARESLVEQNHRIYMNRKTCRCWGKMTGSCPNCARAIKVEQQGSAAISVVDTVLRKGDE